MAAVANDGAVQYGSRVITIPVSTGTAFVFDNVETSRPTNAIEQTNELGEPSGQVLVDGFVTGSGVLQMQSGVDAPLLGEIFTETFDATIGAESFYVSSVGQPETKDGEKKCNIEFRKKIN
jgi:hypothetical protein